MNVDLCSSFALFNPRRHSILFFFFSSASSATVNLEHSLSYSVWNVFRQRVASYSRQSGSFGRQVGEKLVKMYLVP
ncbi:hypothetical protein BJ166DRAFT_513247 [Pestalotiopsis sp. NC0098]|nr:hypothetical protein BJ166DRAFT_513247 [Pestalotiopsis sp. NC0098]